MKHIIHLFRNASLLTKQILCFFLVSVIPLMILNACYLQSVRRTVMEQNDRSTRQLLLQLDLSLDNSFNSVDALALSLIFDPSISDILSEAGQLPLEQQIENRNYLQERLKNARSIHDWITSITIVSEHYVVSSAMEEADHSRLLQEPWLTEFLAGDSRKQYTPVYTNSYIGRYGIPAFSLLRRIDDPETGEKRGCVIVEMRYSRLEALFSDVEQPESGMALVTDSSGRLIYHPDQSLVGTFLADNADLAACLPADSTRSDPSMIVHTRTVDETDWTIIDLKYTDYLLQEAYQTWGRMAWICAGLFLIAMMMATGLSLYISRPIRRLVLAMKEVESGNLKVQLPVESDDDVGHLALGFNSMTAHLQQLIDQVYEKEQEKRQAELQALQAQINPHFLYNTLGAVRWMAVMHNADSISKILLALIRLLEFSTKRTAEFVSIQDEVEHVEYYAQLLQIRYADKFSLKTEIDPDALSCRTIRFLLQPLVENAVFHGIEAKDGPGTVKLTIRRCADRVAFYVQDDGVGMDGETVARKAFTGVGINNVNQRLKSYFGPESCLQIESKLGYGTCVHFTIPYEQYQNIPQQEDLPCTEY